MANYRNSLQIYADVLEKTGEKGRQGIKVTELLTKSNLSHPRLVPLLKKFTQSGLINEIIYDDGRGGSDPGPKSGDERRIVGIRGKTKEGEMEYRSSLTIGAGGVRCPVATSIVEETYQKTM